MIVGVTVTRTGITPPQGAVARSALAFMRAVRLHHGDCRRGDAALHALARKLGIAVEIHPPDKRGLRAFCEALPGETVRPEKPYLDRNRDIVDAVGFMLALPENEDGEILRSGTWSTVRYARRVERPGLIVRPSGRVESLLDPNGAPGTLPAPCSTCGAVVAHTLHADHYPAWEPVPHWAPCGAWCFEGRGEALATREGIRKSHRQLDCGTPGCEGGVARAEGYAGGLFGDHLVQYVPEGVEFWHVDSIIALRALVARICDITEQAGINAEMAARRERVAVTERWIRECSPAICAGGFLGMTVRENLHENPDIDPNDQRIIYLRTKYPLPVKTAP